MPKKSNPITARYRREQANKPPRIVIRCACCRKADTEVEVLIDIGPVVVCDQCIELAARAVRMRKGAR